MDVRTLFLAQTGALAATAAMLWVGGADADRRNGLRTWAIATTAQALAYLLLANVGRLGTLPCVLLGNALGALSVALYFVAIRQFLNRPYHLPWLALMVLAVSAVAFGDNYAGSTIFNGFVYGVIELLNGRALWRSPAPDRSRLQRVVSIFYWTMGVVLPARAAALWLDTSRLDLMHLPVNWQEPIYTFAFLFIIVTNLGFMQMCKSRAEAAVRLLAMTDELTGLGNRRALDDAMTRALATAQRSQRPFAVVMADLDHFKAINDEFGHRTGDRALAAFAQRLGSGLRAQDQPFRYGGEEFCVLLPDADARGALAQAERVRQHVYLPAEAGARALSASFGVAVWTPGDTGDTLFGRADQALYCAKQSGRNRVEMG